VWAQIEAGAGTRVDYRVLEHGDVRCNRTAYGAFVGERWYPLLDGEDPRDLRVRNRFFAYLGATPFTGTPPAQLAAQLLRACVAHPRIVSGSLGWLTRASDGSGSEPCCGTGCGRSPSLCTSSWTPPTSPPPGS